MPELEVSELVREHGLDFVDVQPRQQSVEEHDASRRTEAGEIRVAVAGALRSIHDEQPLGREFAALEQTLDTIADAGVGQWFELVEQRCDQHRIKRQHQQLKCDPRDPRIEPP